MAVAKPRMRKQARWMVKQMHRDLRMRQLNPRTSTHVSKQAQLWQRSSGQLSGGVHARLPCSLAEVMIAHWAVGDQAAVDAVFDIAEAVSCVAGYLSNDVPARKQAPEILRQTAACQTALVA